MAKVTLRDDVVIEQCIPYSACLRHVSDEDCEREADFCKWINVGSGSMQSKQCRAFEPCDVLSNEAACTSSNAGCAWSGDECAEAKDAEDGGTPQQKQYEAFAGECYAKSDKDDCIAGGGDGGASCRWVTSASVFECALDPVWVGASLPDEEERKEAVTVCNTIDRQFNDPPYVRKQKCEDPANKCIVNEAGADVEYCAYVGECAFAEAAECINLPACYWDYVDARCGHADLNDVKEANDGELDISLGLECYVRLLGFRLSLSLCDYCFPPLSASPFPRVRFRPILLSNRSSLLLQSCMQFSA
jgi:hypothetical protein